jgi:polysaccharide export outer membrane protein
MVRQTRLLILFLSILITPGFVYCQDNKELARQHYQKGNTYYEVGRYKEAQEEFQKALDLLGQKEPSSVPQPAIPAEKTKIPTEPQAAQKPKQTSEYLIGNEDVLLISVWMNKDLDQEVIVRPDGMISFPLTGDILVEGLTLSQLKKEITDKLKEYIKYPEVSISVKKLGGQKIIVLGEVSSEGVYQGTGKMTVLEAIASAGGFTSNAVVSSVILIRGGFSSPKGIRLNLNRALLKADMSQNMYLEPQDIIYVPKKFIANVNYFVNQIIGPISQGAYSTEKLRMAPW